MTSDILERLQDAFVRVKYFPEERPTGWRDLLTLRNLVPIAISRIKTQRTAIEAMRPLLQARAATLENAPNGTAEAEERDAIANVLKQASTV